MQHCKYISIDLWSQGSNTLSGSKESNLNKEQEKKCNSEIIQLEVICQALRKRDLMIFDVFLREFVLFVCLSLCTHNAFDLNPKQEGE